MKRILAALKIVAVNIAVFVVAMEVGLRLVPSAIPEGLLRRFEATLRASIAERRSLPNVSDVVQVARDDGGPPLLIFKPNIDIEYVSEESGKTGRIHIDERGFCNPAGTVGADGRVDVVAVGDSYTACMNEPPDSVAPESYVNWPFAFGRAAGLRVYNLSRGSLGLYEYVQLLKHYGLPLRPRLVIMQIYEGNDLRDAVRHHAYQAASPEAKANTPLRASWEPMNVSYEWLLRGGPAQWSYAYNFIVVGLAQLISDGLETLKPPSGDNAAVDFRFTLDFGSSKVPMNPDNNDKDEVRTARSARSGVFRFNAFDAALEQYAALAKKHRFTAVISYAPAAHVAYATSAKFGAADVKDLMLWYSAAQRAHVAAKCRELGIAFIDLTPALQAEADRLGGERLLYKPSNIHFTVLGHHVVALELKRSLAANNLLSLAAQDP